MRTKIFALLALLALPALVAAQVPGGQVVVNGNAVSLVGKDAATGHVSIVVPNASASAQILTGGSKRVGLDGGGTLSLPISNPAAASTPIATTNSSTVDTTNMWQRVSNAGATTGNILEAGTTHGQIVIVTVDKDASGSVTMAAEATSNVCSGTGCVIAAGESAMFIWDATDTCWSENGL